MKWFRKANGWYLSAPLGYVARLKRLPGGGPDASCLPWLLSRPDGRTSDHGTLVEAKAAAAEHARQAAGGTR